MKRLFLAIKIKPEMPFEELIKSLKKELNYEHIKWVEWHNLHLTLKFFGETHQDKIADIISALAKAIETKKQFDFEICKLGIFGSSYDPRVVWAGLQKTDSLLDLLGIITTELKVIGYQPDRQNFIPHLTLGRIKSLSDKDLFQHIISKYKEEYFQKVAVKEVFLFESILTREGPIYKIVEKFELA